MDNNNNKRGSARSASVNTRKNVNRTHVRVIKHFQPTTRVISNDASAELPCVGLAEDGHNDEDPLGLNPTQRARTTSVKFTIRATNKSNSQRHSSLSCSTNTIESKPKPRVKLQYTCKKTTKKDTTENKTTKSPKSNSSKNDDSYIKGLKNEISQFQSTQASLTKAADDLKTEIKEFRTSLASTFNTPNSTETKNVDVKDCSTIDTQTSFNSLMKDYVGLFYSRENSNSVEIDEWSTSLLCPRPFFQLNKQESTVSKFPVASLAKPSTSSLGSKGSTIIQTIPNWVFDRKDEISNFTKTFSSTDSSQLSIDKITYPSDDFLFAKVSSSVLNDTYDHTATQQNNIGFIKHPPSIDSARSSNINKLNTKNLQPKYVTFDRKTVNDIDDLKADIIENTKCFLVDRETQKNENDIPKSKSQTSLVNERSSKISVSDRSKVQTRTIDSKVKKNQKESNKKGDASDLRVPKDLKNIPTPAFESNVEVEPYEENQVCKDCSMKSDQHTAMLEEQRKQMKAFSDVIEKARHLVTLISGDIKIRSNPPVENVLQLFNVSTQVDITDSVTDKRPSKRDAKENTESVSYKDEGTSTVAVTSVKNELDENKLTQNAEVRQSNLKKLSTHLMPPVQIPRELVTQKIPSVNISPKDSTFENTVEPGNLGFEVVKHDSEDNQKLCKLIDIVKGFREQNSVIPPEGDDQKCATTQLNDSEQLETFLTIAGTNVYPTISNKIVQVLQDPEAQYMCKSYQVLENPKALKNCSLPEIDTNSLSFIDDDVYKTYVNPNGKNSHTDSKSSKSVASMSANSNDQTSNQKKASGTDLPNEKENSTSYSFHLDDDSKASINSILTRNRESLNEFMKINGGERKPIFFPDAKYRSYLKQATVNQNYTKYEFPENSVNGMELISKSKSFITRNSINDIPSNTMKIDSTVSANLKDYMAHPKTRISADRVFRDTPSFTNEIKMESRSSKVSRTSEKELSDSTEQLILSIDKVDLHRKSGFYRNDEKKLPLFEIAKRTSKSLRNKPLHKTSRSSYKNFDSSDEHIVMRDMRMQTLSAFTLVEDSGLSKNSKESSSTHNTDESFKIVHLNDSADEDTVYCSYCSKLCFGRKRRIIQDDVYTASSNRNSVQFLRNRGSQIRGEVYEGKGRVQSIGELNELLEKKLSINERHAKVQRSETSDEASGKVQGCDEIRGKVLKDPRAKLKSDEVCSTVSTDNMEHRRSVKIDVPAPRQCEKDSSVETFIKGLTNTSSHLATPVAPLTYAKSSDERNQCTDENKKKLTVMSVNVDRSTFAIINGAKGGGGDKNSFQSKIEKSAEASLNSKEDEIVKQVLLYDKIENNAQHTVVKDECQQSDGEVLNKSDRSIGEVHVYTGNPENIFIQDLRKSHKKIVNRKVQNSNWISYYVTPIRRHKAHAPVPVNDSSDSLN